MSSRILPSGLAIPIIATALAAQAAPPPVSPGGSPPPPTASPALAVEAGDAVFDRTGQPVGQVQSLVETPAGPMVVARIDGKMISLPQSTLKKEDGRLISSQSKTQMIDAAGAPR